LLEHNLLPLQAGRAQTAGRCIDGFGAGKRRQDFIQRAGKHVATTHAFVFQNTVVKEVNGAAFVRTEQR